ncbi:MAG: DUF5071 domain-containing protein [Tenericutes bacterium]|nr:DUF5071 domain-containing protein [Mycoplasmatota bacterium]
MNREEIEDLIVKLDWYGPVDIQDYAIQKLIKIDYSQWYLILPKRIYPKKLWENAAKVLKGKKNKEIKSMTLDMFHWLKDLNWPGVEIIIEILQKLPIKELKIFVSKAILIADITGDDEWKENIYNVFGEVFCTQDD